MPSTQYSIELATVEGTPRELVPQKHVVIQIQKRTLRICIAPEIVGVAGHAAG